MFDILIRNGKIVDGMGNPWFQGTVAMVVNSVHRVIDAPSGLVTVKDLPMVSALGLSA